jgi:2-pyrone-4,6-dicarboxylate lactonase
MTEPDFLTDAGRKPKLKAPPKTCDTHSHIYGPLDKYPRQVSETRIATLEAYKGMLDRLGIERCVIVHSSMYGYDNSVTLDAIAALGQDMARGSAVIPGDISREELQRLHDGGMRGVRVSSSNDDISIDNADKIAARIAPLGWILQLQEKTPNWISRTGPMLKDLPCPVVFDHFGRTSVAESAGGAEFQTLLKLLADNDNIWVRLSALYTNSRSGPPDYADVAERAKALVATRPDRLLFAMNWPHPRFPFPGVVDSADCLDPFEEWIPDEKTREMVLATNAGKLYGFDT